MHNITVNRVTGGSQGGNEAQKKLMLGYDPSWDYLSTYDRELRLTPLSLRFWRSTLFIVPASPTNTSAQRIKTSGFDRKMTSQLRTNTTLTIGRLDRRKISII